MCSYLSGFSWLLAFHYHGNQDGGKHSKNNSFVQL